MTDITDKISKKIAKEIIEYQQGLYDTEGNLAYNSEALRDEVAKIVRHNLEFMFCKKEK